MKTIMIYFTGLDIARIQEWSTCLFSIRPTAIEQNFMSDRCGVEFRVNEEQASRLRDLATRFGLEIEEENYESNDN